MTDIHSCSYYCDRPECVKAQRDELRSELERLRAQEPVAWQQRYIDSEEGPSLWRECSKNDIEFLRTSPQREVRPIYRAAPPAQPADLIEMSPEFTDTARSALLWVLWHHQGASSEVGQPIRFALGMDVHEHLSDYQVREAKRWGALTQSVAAQPAQRLTDEHRQQLVEVLRGGRQCDEDGVEIIMSRQACCEAADIIESAIAADPKD